MIKLSMGILLMLSAAVIITACVVEPAPSPYRGYSQPYYGHPYHQNRYYYRN